MCEQWTTLRIGACFLFVCWSNRQEITFIDSSSSKPLGAADRVGVFCENTYQRAGYNCETNCKCVMYDHFRKGYSTSVRALSTHDKVMVASC